MNRKEYTRDIMLKGLTEYFKSQGYQVEEYNDRFLPARVPLYCKKEKKGKTDEIVIDFTTANIISKDTFFPTDVIDGVKIHEASPVRFYQYYFIKAKTYLAYPDYVEENEDFSDFKKVCSDRGIGLLKTSETKIEEIIKPRSLFEDICKKLNIKNYDAKMELEYHLRNCLHYFVYYPEPIFKKRAITNRTEQNIPFILIDKLCELKNVAYKKELITLAFKYRREARDDYDIAEKCITQLWKKYLGLDYPNIQRRVENILQRDEEYREHFVHQFQVFLIGTYILDSIYPEISETFKSKYECKIENVWLPAATFHDFSYGLQNFDTWLMQFFEETLRVKYSQTKENLNILNLDAAMIREALYDNIKKMVNQLKNEWEKNEKENLIRFFYEKAVRDRNHSVLSAISLLKLYDYADKKNIKIKESAILQAAIGIGGHDEDIWESLCGCQGYRRSHRDLPTEEKCIDGCGRTLWSPKRNRIYKEKILDGRPRNNIENYRCEEWEKAVMDRRLFEKIKFEESPILFLLIYCDNVQDWGRITSSDKKISNDLSSLKAINIEEKDGKISICVNLQSSGEEEKEDEIERMAWCLKDDRFKVYINEKLKIMNGNGGE